MTDENHNDEKKEPVSVKPTMKELCDWQHKHDAQQRLKRQERANNEYDRLQYFKSQ